MNTIKVYCIGQERWFIKKQRCTCGGAFDQELQQALTRGPSGRVDEITTRCVACGAVEIFRFDISACSAHLQSRNIQKIAAYSKVMPEEEAAKLVMVPDMERALEFVGKLRDTKDALGLEYLAEAISRAQQWLKN
jgi:hypothetical protein